MKKNYDFEWLDDVITIKLNPENNNLQSVTAEQATAIRDRIEEEEAAILSRLKSRVFKLRDELEARNLVKKYHDALILMITKNYDHLLHPTTAEINIRQLHEFIGARLHRMLEIFETEFHAFVDERNLVPITRLIAQRAEMFEREMEMKTKLAAGEMGTGPVHVVMEVFLEFSEKIDARKPVTIHEAAYIRGLFQNVIDLDGEYTSITGCPALNELLIFWNLNSKTCIRYFTQGTEYLMNGYATEEEKVAFLKLELKKVQIIPEKQDFILDPDFPSVKEYCRRWLQNEIAYRETRLEGFVPLAREAAQQEMKKNAFKVIMAASVDQLSLILRAAYDSRLLSAKSLSAVFKAITPYLSTPATEHINWDNARTKSYVAEEVDKSVAIASLEKLISYIKQY